MVIGGVLVFNNGIDWTYHSMLEPPSSFWETVCFGNKFVTLAYDGSMYATSSDAISWTSGDMGITSNGWIDISYGNSKFIAISKEESDLAISSIDGINWNKAYLPNVQNWQSVCFGDGKFVAIGNGKYCAIIS